MEVATPMDFDFNSSSYVTDAYYISAPSSPSQLKELYCEFDKLLIAATANCRASPAAVPFAWEEKPGVPKTPVSSFEDDFSFDVSCRFDCDSIPAEELFQGGRIKTIDPPVTDKKIERERGRERGFYSSSRLPSSRSRRIRSLSPLGASDYRREQRQPVAVNTKTSSAPICSNETGSRKWSFMDLFLFRSASDGRAMDKDPLKKYSTIYGKQDQAFSNSCEPGSTSKRRRGVSPHELHYNVNRAAAHDMKKKTYLPYKQGILGGLSFNP